MEQTLPKRTVIFVNDAVLSNGVRIPMIGFGTYHATDELGQSVLEEALRCGYRSFDTAVLYRNEEMLGAAVEASDVPRERLFLASKVPQNDLGYDRLLYHAEQSMRRLKTDYLDLCLIHWPAEERHSDAWRQLDRDTWRAMERLYDEGVLRAIGVSNFLPHHLLNLFASANIRPMVNEIEFHPGYTQPYVTEFCRKKRHRAGGLEPDRARQAAVSAAAAGDGRALRQKPGAAVYPLRAAKRRAAAAEILVPGADAGKSGRFRLYTLRRRFLPPGDAAAGGLVRQAPGF